MQRHSRPRRRSILSGRFPFNPAPRMRRAWARQPVEPPTTAKASKQAEKDEGIDFLTDKNDEREGAEGKMVDARCADEIMCLCGWVSYGEWLQPGSRARVGKR